MPRSHAHGAAAWTARPQHALGASQALTGLPVLWGIGASAVLQLLSRRFQPCLACSSRSSGKAQIPFLLLPFLLWCPAGCLPHSRPSRNPVHRMWPPPCWLSCCSATPAAVHLAHREGAASQEAPSSRHHLPPASGALPWGAPSTPTHSALGWDAQWGSPCSRQSPPALGQGSQWSAVDWVGRSALATDASRSLQLSSHRQCFGLSLPRSVISQMVQDCHLLVSVVSTPQRAGKKRNPSRPGGAPAPTPARGFLLQPMRKMLTKSFSPPGAQRPGLPEAWRGGPRGHRAHPTEVPSPGLPRDREDFQAADAGLTGFPVSCAPSPGQRALPGHGVWCTGGGWVRNKEGWQLGV